MNLSSWMFSGLAGAIGLVSLVWVVPQLAAPCCPPEGAYVPEDITVDKATADKPKAVRQATVQVEGMTCDSCASQITASLQKLTGVASAQVEVEQKKAIVGYDPAQVSTQAMLEAIQKLGYTATLIEDKANT
jgi:copper chaperone CopZ